MNEFFNDMNIYYHSKLLFQLYNDSLIFIKIALKSEAIFYSLKEKNIFDNWQFKEEERKTFSKCFTCY